MTERASGHASSRNAVLVSLDHSRLSPSEEPTATAWAAVNGPLLAALDERHPALMPDRSALFVAVWSLLVHRLTGRSEIPLDWWQDDASEPRNGRRSVTLEDDWTLAQLLAVIGREPLPLAARD